MGSLLKTTEGQWTILVSIVLISIVMMYFTFTPYSIFGLEEPFAGMPPRLNLMGFRDPDKHRYTTDHNLLRFRG
jgi:hypothetical protein